MNTMTFGKSRLSVSPIGLGLAALGRPGYINLGHSEDLKGEQSVADMRRRCHLVLDAAWEKGIRYFDAARSYGLAEDFLGEWLIERKIRPEDVTVGSKWGYVYTADWHVNAAQHEVKDLSVANLNRQFRESSDRLGPYLKLYQIHSATQQSGVIHDQEVLSQLGELRDQGLVVGLSLSGPHQADTLREALDVQVSGRPLFGAVQATWNLLAQEVGPLLQEAHEAGLGVVVKEALANGRLTTRNYIAEDQPTIDRLQSTAQAHDTTIDALAIAVVLAQPWADCVLSGATTVDQLESNVKAAEMQWDGEMSALTASLVEAPEAYWAKRSQLKWN